jgi:hypothetical protein
MLEKQRKTWTRAERCDIIDLAEISRVSAKNKQKNPIETQTKSKKDKWLI